MQFDDESDVSEDVSLFESAVHPRRVELQRPALSVVVAVLDGSNQDDTARALAAAAAARGPAQVVEQQGAAAAEEILRLCAARHADLLVVPVPFGRDSGILKDESLGSVVDMLLLESMCPVLCVRDVLDSAVVDAALRDVILSANVHDESCLRAVNWALRLLNRGDRLELLAVADRDVIAEARRLLGEQIDAQALQSEAINRAVTREISGLIAAVQKYGSAEGLLVHVEVQFGRVVEVVLEAARQRPRLIIAGAPKDHNCPAFHRAVDLVLGATGPVLVV
jgi:nucleotide-binding universal stress UspA family protein